MVHSEGSKVQRDVGDEPQINHVALAFFEVAAAHIGVSLEELCGPHAALVKKKSGKISWNELTALYDRLKLFETDGLAMEEFGKLDDTVAQTSAAMKTLTLFLAQIATPRLLYRAVTLWSGSSINPVIQGQMHKIGTKDIRITLEIAEGYRDCESYMRASVGSMRTLPRLLGLEPSVLKGYTATSRRLVIDLELPPGRSVIHWLFSLPRMLLGANFAVRELMEQQQALQKRYAELESSHQEAERLRKVATIERKRAEQALKVKSEFLSVMSHELRTPMNGIVGGVDALRDDMTHATGEQRQLLNIVDECSQQMLNLVTTLLDFSELKAGEYVLRQEPMSLEDETQSLLAAAHTGATEKGIGLHLEIAENVPRKILSDAHRYRQIVDGLLNNAIKFTEAGSVTIRIKRNEVSVSAKTDSEENSLDLCIEVSDTGLGIQKDKLDTIFESFEQFDSTAVRTFGGLGIGLALTRMLVHLFGGEISCNSVHGEGTTFKIEIPVQVHQQDHHPAETKQENLKSIASTSKLSLGTPTNSHFAARMSRALLIEDNTLNAQVLEALLRRLQVDVVTKHSGQAGLTVFEHEPFDIVFMDCRMPVMDGFTASKKLRQMEKSRQPASIIATTANTTQADREKCTAVGMDAFVAKPISKKLVSDALNATHPQWKDLKSPHALVIEDNPINRKVLSRLLRKLGFAVDTAENGIEGVKAYYNRWYDVVFMDCAMPLMDGYDACIHIREFERHHHTIPLVAVTALTHHDEIQRGTDAGMNDLIRKPVTFKKLKEVWCRWVESNADGPLARASGGNSGLDEIPVRKFA